MRRSFLHGFDGKRSASSKPSKALLGSRGRCTFFFPYSRRLRLWDPSLNSLIVIPFSAFCLLITRCGHPFYSFSRLLASQRLVRAQTANLVISMLGVWLWRCGHLRGSVCGRRYANAARCMMTLCELQGHLLQALCNSSIWNHAGFLFIKGVNGFNEEAERQDKLDGYL